MLEFDKELEAERAMKRMQRRGVDPLDVKGLPTGQDKGTSYPMHPYGGDADADVPNAITGRLTSQQLLITIVSHSKQMSWWKFVVYMYICI